MSSVVAVAGGTGGLGRAIVDALKANAKLTVLVLSRQPSEEKQKEIGARFVVVDYNDPAALTEALEKNKVDTVISTLTSMAGPGPELALINAADTSTVTKRFIPSLWGVPYSTEMIPLFPPAQLKLDLLASLKKTSLEYTTFYNGYFFDYFVPTVPTYLQPLALMIDIPNNAIAIPGTGDVPVVFTHTWDIAKFVTAYIEKPEWDREAYIIGDKITFNEFVRLAEDIKGVKFNVSYDSEEDLAAGKATELPSYPHVYPFFPKEALLPMVAGMGWMMHKGYFDLDTKRALNKEFEAIKPRTIKELLVQAYKS